MAEVVGLSIAEATAEQSKKESSLKQVRYLVDKMERGLNVIGGAGAGVCAGWIVRGASYCLRTGMQGALYVW